MATRRDRIIQPGPHKKILKETPRTPRELDKIEEKILDGATELDIKIRDLIKVVNEQVMRPWYETREDEREFTQKVLETLEAIHRKLYDVDWLVHCAVIGRDMMTKKANQAVNPHDLVGALERIAMKQPDTNAGLEALKSMMQTIIENTSTTPARSRKAIVHPRAPSVVEGQATHGGSEKTSIWVWFENAKLFVSFAAGAGALWFVIMVFTWVMAWGQPIVTALVG
ncbi:hypothetical protein B0T19DRAFT_446587 [Cercophora scortea]|uniref:Uncharacterized protein n=1 Tax=Cercophora scortea TaxID=314031 RepID=A0AAE0I327_9PEZI|nr:hypothetical protein B0T19DRAFT_446587 [Cercophora scortea]